eukprot:jgi/Psemu1/9863/gm1.9863_g
MPQWGHKQKDELVRLFEKGLDNPGHTKARKINPYYTLSPEFAKACSAEHIEPEDIKLEPEDIKPEGIMFADKEPAFKETMLAISTMYKEEIELKHPLFVHTSILLPTTCVNLSSLCRQLHLMVLKFKPNPVLGEPHHIHAYQTAEHGCIFADDLLTAQTFKKSAAVGVGKWYTFCHKCSWQSEFSEDLAGINPLIKSIKRLEKKTAVMSTSLSRKPFSSPSPMALFMSQRTDRGIDINSPATALK